MCVRLPSFKPYLPLSYIGDEHTVTPSTLRVYYGRTPVAGWLVGCVPAFPGNRPRRGDRDGSRVGDGAPRRPAHIVRSGGDRRQTPPPVVVTVPSSGFTRVAAGESVGGLARGGSVVDTRGSRVRYGTVLAYDVCPLFSSPASGLCRPSRWRSVPTGSHVLL